MKFSEKWLREWVNPEIDSDTLAAQLTMAGLEVDALEPVAGAFSGVVVAEILSAEPHPDAQKLQVCKVNDGVETLQIVCGAANARPGIKIPCARVGAVLPGDFKIKKAKLRGVESFGMLCAEQELGMAESSDGLMELAADAPVGTDIREYLQLDDNLFELGLTPNRADCLSVRGIAREVAVLNKIPFVEPEFAPVAAAIEDVLPVQIDAGEDCPRYVGRVVRGIDIAKPSPLWLQEKLRRSGLRSIDAVVDITNLVLLELGQPMHAFDLEKLSGGIVVRKATEGEKLTLLDEQEIELRADSLVIADQTKPLALAGIMGGLDSSVGDQTRDLFLEAAFFAPDKLAGRARSYGLHTDSSHRFERGVDYALAERAIERATQLIIEICGGQAGPTIKQNGAEIPEPQAITLRAARIKRMLGMSLPNDEVVNIISGLGLDIKAEGEGWKVFSASWRFDIAIEEDLLEELARIYGYNRLPVTPMSANLEIIPKPEKLRPQSQIRRQLVARGYQEAVTYSFIDPALHEIVSEGGGIELMNPISADMAIMRDSLFPGLLKTAEYNSKRQQQRVRLFEIGLRFNGKAAGEQIPTLAGLITGRRSPESWNESGELVDFFDLKGDLEALLALSPSSVSYVAGSRKALHPGQSAQIVVSDKAVGWIGALHPSVQAKLDMPNSVYLFEIDLAVLTENRVPKFEPLSKFPEVRRDIAVIVPKAVAAQALLDCVKKAAGEQLHNLRLFDIYQGKGIDPERKSIALGLTFRDSSRTLNEEEVSQSVAAVVDALQQDLGATLRN
ncbi:phenylalanine--tRNA ligase subunit beta [Spongiibacter sp. KMU-158]|uniref:Phenylalanine--tRNA ligase beta subunit n=1 Tax=Spongiibacter pelagi TaxID=2760804 RepID=A0A927C3P2_9GAMM|nr:phenylalanine--tRNA ligase subunit beta [Spongiibacter pelagi]MBD2859191.1 phenylalanine--tRNA ligase subunit beta [Spongiibacter pelagi]